MKMRYPVLIFGGLCCSAWGFLYRPFPLPGKDSVLDLVLYHTPNFYIWIVRWYYAAPAVTVIVGGLLLITVWRVWFEDRNRNLSPLGKLPKWPLKPGDPGPGIVVGEVHHPVAIPERELYTGVAIFGAVGSGKTSACMHPLAQQILSWQAGNSQRGAGKPQLSEQRRTLPGRDGDFPVSVHRGALVSAPNDSATAPVVPEGSQRERGEDLVHWFISIATYIRRPPQVAQGGHEGDLL